MSGAFAPPEEASVLSLHARAAAGRINLGRSRFVAAVWPVSVVGDDGQLLMSPDTLLHAVGDAGDSIVKRAVTRQPPERAGRGTGVDRQKDWRRGLANVDLESIAKPIRELGVDSHACKSLDDAYELAQAVVSGKDNHFRRMELTIQLLKISREYHQPIMQRWSSRGYPPLTEYAPFTAHVVAVELFFLFAIASHQIGTSRSSNRIDIAYLYYLPFCMMFVSNDKLHRRCAPYFLREDQEFVWGPELKTDMAAINEHFMAYPDSEKDRGIMAFASRAPSIDGSLTRRLRSRFLTIGYDDQPVVDPPPKDDPRTKELLRMTRKWENAPDSENNEQLPDDPEMISIARKIRMKKGSWWQLPKDLDVDQE